MMTETVFTDYKTAHTKAVNLARFLKKEVGIEATKEFGKSVFVVHHLPKLENRYGYELRMEVVAPTDPL